LARIVIPAQYVFTEAAGTRKALEMMQNPTSGRELGLLRPKTGEWFVVFRFADIGHVKDDEKDKLDPVEILRSIREGTEAANETRKKNGWEVLKVLGWDQPPRYNAETHHVEWAVRAKSADHDVVNFNIRYLGRRGVMEANLVCDPQLLARILPEARRVLAEFSFNPGERYAEFKSGDRVAEIGLATLIAGGAAAVALKTGLLQKFWKLIVVGVLAVLGAIKRVFARLFGRGETAIATPDPAPTAPDFWDDGKIQR